MRKGAGVANTLARLFLLHSWGPLQPRGLVSLIMVELLLACGVAASLGSLPVEVSRRARPAARVNWGEPGSPAQAGLFHQAGSSVWAVRRSRHPSRRCSGRCRAGSLRIASQDMTEILGVCPCHNITGVARAGHEHVPVAS